MSNIENTNKEGLRAYREINLSNLKHNLLQIKSLIDDNCKVMAVVKADAYGHGAVEISIYLQRLGIKHFAVACIDEAIELRKAGIKGEILVLGYTPIYSKNDLISYNISQTIVDINYAKELCKLEGILDVHIKLDTGMNRLGTKFEELEELINIYKSEKFNVKGTFSHLSRADSVLEDDVNFTNNQVNKFYEIIDKLKECNIDVGKIHLQSSYGITNYKNLKCDLVRPGIILYGVSSMPNDKKLKKLGLKPVLSLKTKIASVKDVYKSETVGYGNNFTVTKDMKIAIATIGYADGYPRGLSKCDFEVLINGQVAKIIGNICMDQMILDVSDIDNIKDGDTVTLIGEDKKLYISIDKISEVTNTINNETLTAIGDRVTKIYI
ncbi:serine racemase VanT catalytic subunit [Romboutsia sp. 1001713B170207_170306_H8]|uniref:serine racemase VanT catalytic subunit n=1 Tax=Romboutsia sp. 1001713B170207_170306_H8 TaxID=2787112 RepID=UPI0008204161|nr:serine racemase VanT catalytic subunit [Romboutsia sp. 1001713B170207_170306_H8]SCH46315.1 Serine/alanine racemase [uncultured Clostridium sp.]